MSQAITIPNLGVFSESSGLIPMDRCSDGVFGVGRDGVVSITATGDRKVEFIAFADHALAYVKSAMGYPAYYPVREVRLDPPVEAVLMDLDGTSVRSEAFWIRIIQMSTASLLGEPAFELEDGDLPYVSGHSVSEHLEHCIRKYCPDKTVEEARRFYFEHTRRELGEIMAGRGWRDAFTPSPGLKEFLLALKGKGVKIGLVTSGLYEKAWPEIVGAFRRMDLGDPGEFYDVIVTAGFPLRKGEAGTLGELSPKPHPWLYAEAARVGLGVPFEARHHVVGIEDSSAGVCAIRLAGFTTVGMAEGNIVAGGTLQLCDHYCVDFEHVLEALRF